MVIFVDIYAHTSQDNVWNKGEKIGLKDDALRLFSLAANEVKLTLQVDVENKVHS